MFNDELGKSLYVSTVLNSGFLPDFSMIMQLVLGRQGRKRSGGRPQTARLSVPELECAYYTQL